MASCQIILHRNFFKHYFAHDQHSEKIIVWGSLRFVNVPITCLDTIFATDKILPWINQGFHWNIPPLMVRIWGRGQIASVNGLVRRIFPLEGVDSNSTPHPEYGSFVDKASFHCRCASGKELTPPRDCSGHSRVGLPYNILGTHHCGALSVSWLGEHTIFLDIQKVNIHFYFNILE